MRKIIVPAIALTCTLLTGCASITTGLHQKITVTTPPAKGAECKLFNRKGSWSIPHTPGTVKVHRSGSALQITCRKPGYQEGRRVVNANIKAMTAGNILFGGFIGAGVDAADGAAYHYPRRVIVPMSKR